MGVMKHRNLCQVHDRSFFMASGQGGRKIRLNGRMNKECRLVSGTCQLYLSDNLWIHSNPIQSEPHGIYAHFCWTLHRDQEVLSVIEHQLSTS